MKEKIEKTGNYVAFYNYWRAELRNGIVYNKSKTLSVININAIDAINCITYKNQNLYAMMLSTPNSVMYYIDEPTYKRITKVLNIVKV